MDTSEYDKIEHLDSLERIFNVKDRTIVIVGGVGKMGQQFAHTLALAGARVVLADLNKKECYAAAEKISKKTKCDIQGFQCDVTQKSNIENLFETVYQEHSRVDSLVYNVMAKPEGYYRPFEKYPLDTWQKTIEGNLTGAMLCCQEAFKYLGPGGSVVLTSSTYGIVGPDQRIYKECSSENNIYRGGDPLSCPVSYSASKAGLIGMVKHLATAWGEKGIRINALTPGGVYDSQEEPFHRAYVQRTPLNRMAVWSDYSGAILFLTSDASRYMTGANLIVDGGWTAW
jgi:NAD(P)-dependent dehydrogenase (short-subunit alcohol dehydrogenase family)